MKKLSIIALAALSMISCGHTYKVKSVELNELNDSINYTLGFVNGYQMKAYYFNNDSSDAAIAEFIDALDRGYNGKVEELSDIATDGQNLGSYIKSFETKGLLRNPSWALNEKILFQGLVNGLLGDTTMMPADEAREYFQTQMQRAASVAPDSVPAKPIKGKCGKKAAKIDLKSCNDSLNYAFGLLNGSEIRVYMLANDTTGEGFKELVAAVNKGLKSKVRNPQLVHQAEQIGSTIKEQEANGLVGVPQLETRFELLKQGFINGLYQDETQFTFESAMTYLNTTMTMIQFGENKANCEKYLEANKLRDSIEVTESGLQYQVLKMGKGPKPAATDTVKVNYIGTMIDGSVFDSSFERSEPATFPLNQVIKGWTEGIQLMPVGSKFRFYIPQELAYGEDGNRGIPPYSALIFEVELLAIEK